MWLKKGRAATATAATDAGEDGQGEGQVTSIFIRNCHRKNKEKVFTF